MEFSRFRKENDRAGFEAAIQYLREHPGTTLTVEPGIYQLTDEQAKAAQYAVMSGAWGENPQNVMFHPKYRYTKGIDLSGVRNCRIQAYGVTLMVDGFMEPISVTDCEDVELCGLTVDHLRKPYSKGVITTLSAPNTDGIRFATVRLDDACPIMEGTPLGLRHVLYDVESDCVIRTKIKHVRYIDPLQISLQLEDTAAVREGLEFYTLHTFHSRPAILIENSKNIHLTDMTIHSQPGMGVVGNRSENITLTRLSVIPSAGEHWSTNTDATHFTSIKGLLRYDGCRFDGQGDDSVNVHAYFQDVIQKETPRSCIIQEKTPSGTHAQTLDYPDVGDILELTERDTLTVVGQYRVVQTEPMPDVWCCRVILDHDLPEDTAPYILADVTRLPRIELVNCYAEKHFARGFLIKSRDVLIEGNVFRDIPLAGIEIAAETHWYEGVSPANVTVRRNRFINCGTAIMIKADCKRPTGQKIFNLTIEDNVIDSQRGIYARNVDGLHLARNAIHAREYDVRCEDCTNVKGLPSQ